MDAKPPMLATIWGHKNHLANDLWLCSEKIDGIRCTIQSAFCAKTESDERVFSRSGKRIPNHYIRQVLGTLSDGLDGEIAPINNRTQDAFQLATTAAMTMEGEPDNWCFYIFDSFANINANKIERLGLANEQVAQWKRDNPKWSHHVRVLPFAYKTYGEAVEYCKRIIDDGGEGVMLSKPNSPYVHRRVRPTECNLIKLKPTQDAEGKIVAFREATYAAEGKTIPEELRGKGKGELGSLIIKSPEFQYTFALGSGFSAIQRKDIWANQEQYKGKIVKFAYQYAGTKDRPRQPVFKGFRDDADMDKPVLTIIEKAGNTFSPEQARERIKQALNGKKVPRLSTLKKWAEEHQDFNSKVEGHINFWLEQYLNK